LEKRIQFNQEYIFQNIAHLAKIMFSAKISGGMQKNVRVLFFKNFPLRNQK